MPSLQGVIKLGDKASESKCTLVYGQMNEPPGARARVALTGEPASVLTAAAWHVVSLPCWRMWMLLCGRGLFCSPLCSFALAACEWAGPVASVPRREQPTDEVR